MATPDWSKEFEIMCDVNDYDMGAVLGQRTENIFRAIYYASKPFNEAQENYSTIKKKCYQWSLPVRSSYHMYWDLMS